MKRTTYFLIIFMVTAFLLLSACSKDESTSPTQETPAIPPETSFVMDFSDFNQNSLLMNDQFDHLSKPQSKNNWAFAAANVWAWQTTIMVGLAVPVASFQSALLRDRTPTFIDGEWIWAYNFNVLAGQYHAELHGKIVVDGVEWAMFISRTGVFEDFEWYTGKSNFLATEGTWTLNKEPGDAVPVIYIEWNRNPENLTYDIKYTNVLEGSDDMDSYIFNGVTTDTTYDAFYDIYGSQQDRMIEIKWHRTAKHGRVKDLVHFSDEDWHCWDENFNDFDCGE